MYLRKNYEEWKKIVTEMGLEESKIKDMYGNINPQIIGNYRNHNIKIIEYDRSSGDIPGSFSTYYNVELENTQTILMSIGKRFYFFPTAPYLWDGKNVRMNDSEFDKQFLVRGNKESEVKAILDPSIRGKILNTRDFNLVIGLHAEKSSNELWNRFFQKLRLNSRSIGVTDVARYTDNHLLSKTKQGAEKFKATIDTIIDIIEKIESYPVSTH